SGHGVERCGARLRAAPASDHVEGSLLVVGALVDGRSMIEQPLGEAQQEHAGGRVQQRPSVGQTGRGDQIGPALQNVEGALLVAGADGVAELVWAFVDELAPGTKLL